MSCWTNIEQIMREEKIFQLQSMCYSMKSVEKVFPVKNFGVSCLALIFNLSNQKKIDLGLLRGLLDMTSQTPSFAPNPFEPMAYWSSRVSVSQAIWVQFSKSTETLCALGHFAWHWARQWTDTCVFVLLHSLLFFSSRISSVLIWCWQDLNSLNNLSGSIFCHGYRHNLLAQSATRAKFCPDHIDATPPLPS